MKPRYFRQVDEETGEALEGFVAVLQPKRSNAFKDWLAMSQPALLEMAKADLGDEARRVLFVILSKLDFENYILLSQADIGKELGIKRPSVHRAIKKLIDNGIILKGPKVGRSSTFRLNESYGWKGSGKNHHKAIKERIEKSGFGVIEGGKSL